MAKVSLQAVRKVYDNGHVAVAGASFEVEDGELLVLVGPSGCGKSTLLRLVAGLEAATSGTLAIGGRVVNDVPPKDRDIAMVFQSYALYPHMTVAENLGFGLKLRKLPVAEIDRRVRQAAELLELGAVLGRRPRQLSGGQRQRVALGRAIVRQPKVFLLDEPLSNLDAKLRLAMRTEIAKLHRTLGATMVYVTHDQIEAMTLGDRIVVMKSGEIQQIAAPMDLYREPANLFVAGFVGSPAMNFLPGKVEGGAAARFVIDAGPESGERVALPLAGAGLAPRFLAELEGRALILGLRPEDVHLVGEVGASLETGGAEQVVPGAPATVRARLEVVEPVGNEVFLVTRLAGREVVARLPPRELPEPGSEIELALDLGKAHWFDAESERRLASTPA